VFTGAIEIIAKGRENSGTCALQHAYISNFVMLSIAFRFFHSSSGLNTPEQPAWLWTRVRPRQALSWQSCQKVGNLLESKWNNAHINFLTVAFKSQPLQLSTKAEHLGF
jgi:hypothetical protein